MNRSNDYAEMFEDADGQNRWRLKAGNHRIIATSGEAYKSWGRCFNMCIRVTGHTPRWVPR
jgi:uncharacterized protein YegP (UPF0339 family)